MNYYEAFPQLEAIDSRLKNDIARIDEEIRELRETDRYNENETERRYLLQELRNKREQMLTDAENEFQTELKAIELSLADRAFSLIDASEEARNKAKETAEAIKTQLLTSLNVVSTLSLLSVKVETMTDVEKQELAVTLHEIKDDIISKAISEIEKQEIKQYIDDIKKELANTSHAKNIAEQAEALRQIKHSASSVRLQFDTIDNALAARGRK